MQPANKQSFRKKRTIFYSSTVPWEYGAACSAYINLRQTSTPQHHSDRFQCCCGRCKGCAPPLDQFGADPYWQAIWTDPPGQYRSSYYCGAETWYLVMCREWQSLLQYSWQPWSLLPGQQVKFKMCRLLDTMLTRLLWLQSDRQDFSLLLILMWLWCFCRRISSNHAFDG